jgi:hypothetical protein
MKSRRRRHCGDRSRSRLYPRVRGVREQVPGQRVTVKDAVALAVITSAVADAIVAALVIAVVRVAVVGAVALVPLPLPS